MYEPMWCGPNDGGIKRGDRAETGDEEARRTPGAGEGGSGVWDPEDDLLDESEGESYDDADAPENYPLPGGDLADLTVLDADDPSLGMTNIGDRPAEDWAADTGPTHSNEEMDDTNSL